MITSLCPIRLAIMLNFNTCRKWSIWFKLATPGFFPLENGRGAYPGFFSLENGRGGKGPGCEVGGTWMKGCDGALILNDLVFKHVFFLWDTITYKTKHGSVKAKSNVHNKNKDKTDRVKD